MKRLSATHVYSRNNILCRRQVNQISLFKNYKTTLSEKIEGISQYTLLPWREHGLPLQILSKDTNEVKDVSWVRGSSEIDLIEDPIGVWFEKQVEKYSTKPALHSFKQNYSLSWKSLNDEVDQFCMGLKKLGFEAGDRFSICLPNCKEWMVAFLACTKLSIIVVNVNPASQESELSHALNLSASKGLLISPQVKKTNYIEILHHLIPSFNEYKEISSQQIPTLRHIIIASNEKHFGMHNFDDLLLSLPLNRNVALQTNSNQPINIQFTSGTTGKPKGATLSHRNILNNGYFCGERMNLSPNDSVCIPVPLFHCFGLVLGTLAGLTHGGEVVYPSDFFEAEQTMKAVDHFNCSVLHGVPTMFASIFNHPKISDYSLSNLRTGIMAGTTCPIDHMKKVIDVLKMKEITIAYGMTETSPVSFQTFHHTTDVKVRVETIGIVHPHCEVKIVNDRNEIVPVGEIGELWTRGYNVMHGYWNDHSQTQQSIIDGWMATGDLATIDSLGYGRIVGRKKDMIIRGGENVYPREIEEFYLEHLDDAIDVQIVGVPDRTYGEAVCMWIKLSDGSTLTEEDIINFGRGKIAHFKIPKYVHIVNANDIPMTLSGKPQKYLIRKKSIELFGLENEVPT